MATTKFYLRTKGADCSIYIRYNLTATKKLQAATGLKIHSEDFSSATGFPKINKAGNKLMNNTLKKLAAYIDEVYNSDYSKGAVFNSEWLKKQIKDFFQRPDDIAAGVPDDNLISVYLANYREYRKLKGETKATSERKFAQLQTKILAFEKTKKKKFTVSDIDSRFILEFRNFIIHDLKNMESTAGEMVRKLKTVLLNARNEDNKTISNSINGLKVKKSKSVKVFLDFGEIEKIQQAKLVGDNLEHARDWLIISCFTGQRQSDLFKMRKESIYTRKSADGQQYRLIELTQEKTGAKVAIPVTDEVETILKKYGGNFPPTFGMKGESINTLYNRYIKRVCEVAGITNMVKGRVWSEEEQRNIITETEKYKLVSSHIGRRSFATNHYGDNRFTTAELMAITGHKTESVFMDYIGKTSNDLALKTAETFRKIADERRERIKLAAN